MFKLLFWVRRCYFAEIEKYPLKIARAKYTNFKMVFEKFCCVQNWDFFFAVEFVCCFELLSDFLKAVPKTQLQHLTIFSFLCLAGRSSTEKTHLRIHWKVSSDIYIYCSTNKITKWQKNNKFIGFEQICFIFSLAEFFFTLHQINK